MTDAVELLRPCGMEFPDGKQFGEWGPMWGYHFDGEEWIKGKIKRAGDMVGQHGGRDIVVPDGTVLRCPGTGKVLASGWQNPNDHGQGFGLRILIELIPLPYGSNSYRFLLTGAHFSELWPKEGEEVTWGQPIGLSGSTGNSSGGHTHWQLEIPGDYPRVPINFEWV